MRILSIDGGGYLGLTTAVFLKETERHFGTSYYKNFDMFCGTSTGAIIALALASGKSGKEICGLYETLGKSIFTNPFPLARSLRSVRSLAFAKYSNKALKATLESAFGSLTLGDIKKSGKFALVPAFSITTGRPRVFKTDHSSDLTRDDGYLLSDIALASSAAPIYFPIVRLRSPQGGEESYCDGGVFANHPALLGYTEAVSHLQVDSEQIRILSLSTPRADLAEWASTENFVRRNVLSRGLIFWRTKILSVIIDSTSMAAHQSLRRLAHQKEPDTNYVRIQFEKPKGVDMDKATKKVTETLKQIGSNCAMDNETRHQVAPFLTEGRIK